MKPESNLPRTLALATLLVLVACGGGEGGDAGSEASTPPDTAVKPLAREPLTEADLQGLSLENLSVELPWTQNDIARDPAAAAARASVLDAEVAGHEGFDRVVFTFDETTPFPGYAIDIVDATTPLACGEEETAPELGTERMLLVRLAPARASEEGRTHVPVRTQSYDHVRFSRAGLVCDDGQQAVWVAGLASGDEVRVLEMRAPNRLVVDVR